MRKTFLDGIALGAFIVLLAFFLAAAFFGLQPFGSKADSYIQTLMTCLATAGTGYLAIRGIREQIQSNVENELARRAERLRAAKATLPLALSELVRNSREMLTAVFMGHFSKADIIVKNFNASEILDILTKCIQYSDQQSGDRIAQIIRYIQVLTARTDARLFRNQIPTNVRDWGLVGHDRIDFAIHWAVLSAICTSAFGFARGSQSQIPAAIELKAVYGTFFVSRIMTEDYPLLVELIEERWNGRGIEMKFDRV
jgi:hypothetical protein